jgi:hypothetical protein
VKVEQVTGRDSNVREREFQQFCLSLGKGDVVESGAQYQNIQAVMLAGVWLPRSRCARNHGRRN